MNQNELERIEAYLLGELSAEELHLFEQELAVNPVLREQTEEVRLLIESVETSSIKDWLNEFHAEIATKSEIKSSKPKRLKLPSWKWVAAACILLIAFTTWFVNDFSSHHNLYQKYYEQDPGLPTVMGETDSYDFYEGMVEYKQNKYSSALKNWEKLLAENPENDTLNYFVAMAYLGKNEPEKAESHLNKTLEFSSSYFTNDAKYYLALTYVKMGKNQKAIELLKTLSSENAKSLLNELE